MIILANRTDALGPALLSTERSSSLTELIGQAKASSYPGPWLWGCLGDVDFSFLPFEIQDSTLEGE